MSAAAPRAIAIDVGGTGIRTALIDAHAKVHDQTWRPTARERGPGPVVRTVTALAAELADAARRVWEQAVDALADTLLQTATILDPPLIVLGGGVAESGELLLSPLRAAMASKAVVTVVPALARAELGERAGCLGAGLAALDLITVRTDMGGRLR